MKLLVFAFIPPPHHGQSVMVERMIEGFGGDRRKGAAGENPFGPIECYHVNARFAPSFEDIGSFRIGKGLLIFKYLAEALWCRFRYGADVLYYCPAPPVKASVLRDVVLLTALRPFFRKTILFWHASGLGGWLESGDLGKGLSSRARRALSGADLAVAPAAANIPDLLKFAPKRSAAVPYGIPDPFPDFNEQVRPRRVALTHEYRAAPARDVSVLFMALCIEEKGLLDAMEAIRILRDETEGGRSGARFKLTVAGKFLNAEEEAKFRGKVERDNLGDLVNYVGFVSGNEKYKLLIESDVFCFPTFYSAESAPVVLLEAMAAGLPVVTTNWRNIPEMFPGNYSGIVEVRQPGQVANAILRVLATDVSSDSRANFLSRFTIEQHLRGLAAAFLGQEGSTPPHLGKTSAVVSPA